MFESIKKKKPKGLKKPVNVLQNDTPSSYTREELKRKNKEYILKKEHDEIKREKKSEKHFNIISGSFSATVMSFMGGVITACTSPAASYSFKAAAAVIAIGGFIYLISKLFG